MTNSCATDTTATAASQELVGRRPTIHNFTHAHKIPTQAPDDSVVINSTDIRACLASILAFPHESMLSGINAVLKYRALARRLFYGTTMK